MYLLKQDQLKCSGCGECTKKLPGYEYREEGHLISRWNYEQNKDVLDSLTECPAITLESAKNG